MGGLIAIVRVFGQTLAHHIFEARRNRLHGDIQAHGAGIIIHVLVGGFQHVLAHEGRLAGQRFINDATQRIYIRAQINFFTGALFRAKIERTAEGFPRASHKLFRLAAFGFVGNYFGNAEIENHNVVGKFLVIENDNIARLQIPVHDIGFISRFHGLADLNENTHGPFRANVSCFRKQIFETLEDEGLHHQHHPPIGKDHVFVGGNMGVAQVDKNPYLLFQLLIIFDGRNQMLVDYLQYNRLPIVSIGGPVNGTESAFSYLFLYLIMVYDFTDKAIFADKTLLVFLQVELVFS